MSKDKFNQEEKERIIDLADALVMETGKTFKETREALAREMEMTGKAVKEANPDLTDGEAEARANVIRSRATRQAGKLVNELLEKVLYQELTTPDALTQFSFVNVFDDVKIEAGNTKEYVFKPDTGMSEYTPNERIASGIVDPKVYASTASMYTIDRTAGTKTLTPNAYQFRKLATVLRNEWIPYFIQGRLEEFISSITSSMRRTYSYFKAHTILQRLYVETSLAVNKASNAQATREGKVKLVEGEASNLYAALSKEIFPILQNMSLGEPLYPFGADANNNYTDAILTSSPDDLIMIVPEAFKPQLAAMLATMPTASMFDISTFINPNNIITLGSQLAIPGAKDLTINGTGTSATVQVGKIAGDENNTISKDLSKKYLPENTILIFDKRYIKHLLQIDVNSSQDWARNLSSDIYLHVWGVSKILPWAPIVAYTNPNLLTMPTGGN